MATVRKRGKYYQIRVSCGYDSLGNQVVQTKSWTPEKGMTEKQITKNSFNCRSSPDRVYLPCYPKRKQSFD